MRLLPLDTGSDKAYGCLVHKLRTQARWSMDSKTTTEYGWQGGPSGPPSCILAAVLRRALTSGVVSVGSAAYVDSSQESMAWRVRPERNNGGAGRKFYGCSAVGSAPALGAGSRRFEPCHSYQCCRCCADVRRGTGLADGSIPSPMCGVGTTTPRQLPFDDRLLGRCPRGDAGTACVRR